MVVRDDGVVNLARAGESDATANRNVLAGHRVVRYAAPRNRAVVHKHATAILVGGILYKASTGERYVLDRRATLNRCDTHVIAGGDLLDDRPLPSLARECDTVRDRQLRIDVECSAAERHRPAVCSRIYRGLNCREVAHASRVATCCYCAFRITLRLRIRRGTAAGNGSRRTSSEE